MRSSAPVQLGQPRLVLDDRAVDHALELHGAAPVRRVLLQHDLLAALPRHELEGPGADGVRRIVGAVFADGGRTHDRGGARGEHRQERGARLLEHELHGERVDGLHGLHVAEEVVGEGILAELGGRMLGIDLALDRELHGLGVERGAVVKGDALAQLEHVVQAVPGHGPRLGQAGDDLRALVGEGDERLHHAAAHAVGVEIGHLCGIEIDGLGHEADDERAGRLRGAGHHREEQQRRHQREHATDRRHRDAHRDLLGICLIAAPSR